MIHIIKPGLLTTIQDLGRRHYTHLGLSPAGAADSVSFQIANLLAGNEANAPALEITLIGPTLEFETAATIAISGYGTSESLPINKALEVDAGTRLVVGSLTAGARAYLAVRGGFEIAEVMGSCSTFLPAKIGGFEGRALRSGDKLAIGERIQGGPRKLSASFYGKLLSHGVPIRVTPSVQSDCFDREATDHFYQQPFTITDQSNRSGLRLAGEPILSANGGELLTEGIALGAIQVPPDGQPIILFVDQQTTGGYPKIANVISADIPRIGQLRPRDEIKFQSVSLAHAAELLREQQSALSEAVS